MSGKSGRGKRMEKMSSLDVCIEGRNKDRKDKRK